MTPQELLFKVLQDPARVAAIPEQEIPALLLQVAGLLTALSTRTACAGKSNDDAEASADSDDRLFTIPQVAGRLSVPKGRVYEMGRRGEIPTIRFGKYVRVRVADLQAWVAQHREKSLDTLKYVTYSSGHDGRRDAAASSAARTHAGRAGRADRRQTQQRSPVGARGDADSGACSTTPPASGEGTTERKT